MDETTSYKSHIDKFYVYKISRVCNNETNCFEIPENSLFCIDNNGDWVECEGIKRKIPGINIDEVLRIVERNYKDPKGIMKNSNPPAKTTQKVTMAFFFD